MGKFRSFGSVILFVLLLCIAVSPTMAQDMGPGAKTTGIAVEAPVQRTYTALETVKGENGQPDRQVPVTTVELIQKATINANKPGGIQPDAWNVQIGAYVFTLERRLSGYSTWGGMRVSASGSTQSNVLVSELRVRGTHFFGSNSSCSAQGPNYGTAYAYNTTIVSASEGPNLYAPNQWHCIKLAHHSARDGSSWPLWLDYQEGPSGVW